MNDPSKTFHKLRVPDDVSDLIRSLHPSLKRKVRAAVKLILENPSAGKALKDDLKGLNSYQVGRLRIIYRITNRRVIEIVAIGPRKIIYEGTFRLVTKYFKEK